MVVNKTCLALLLCVASATATAGQVYKWIDANGRVHYSDLPQPGWKRMDLQSGNASATASATNTEDSVNDDEFDDSTDLAGADPEPSAALRKEECARRRDQLEGYRNASRIVETDASGAEKVYSENERLQLIERTQRQVKELCS